MGNVACSVYGASKGAVVSFTKSLSLEMAPHSVTPLYSAISILLCCKPTIGLIISIIIPFY